MQRGISRAANEHKCFGGLNATRFLHSVSILSGLHCSSAFSAIQVSAKYLSSNVAEIEL